MKFVLSFFIATEPWILGLMSFTVYCPGAGASTACLTSASQNMGLFGMYSGLFLLFLNYYFSSSGVKCFVRKYLPGPGFYLCSLVSSSRKFISFLGNEYFGPWLNNNGLGTWYPHTPDIQALCGRSFTSDGGWFKVLDGKVSSLTYSSIWNEFTLYSFLSLFGLADYGLL